MDLSMPWHTCGGPRTDFESWFYFRRVFLVSALCDMTQASWSVSSWVILSSQCFKSVGITDVCSCIQLVM